MTKTKVRSLKELDPAIAHDRGFEFELKDPETDEGVGMFITVTGEEGHAYRNHMEAVIDARLKEEHEGKTKPPKLQQQIDQAIEKAVACTLKWRNMVWDEAEGEIELTPDNARKIYAHKFVRAQVLAAIEDRTNFTAG